MRAVQSGSLASRRSLLASLRAASRAQGIDGTFEWGEGCFSEPIAKVWEVVKYVVNHQKPLSRFRELGENLTVKPEGGCELLKYCETRFASKIMMVIRYRNLLPLFDKWLVDDGQIVGGDAKKYRQVTDEE